MATRKLIVSDVDNTLLGNDEDLARFATWYEENRSETRLVYASGRFVDSVAESVRTTLLPVPDAIIGGVGTEIQLCPSGKSLPDWDEKLSNCWDADQVREVLAVHSRLVPQLDEFQSDYKISYFLRNATITELEQIRTRLAQASIAADLIYSSFRDLDVLPAGFSKGAATRTVAEHFQHDAQDVLVCGDSANDLSMFQYDWRGVVVGNAHPELIELDDPLIYHSDACFAAGVLDGLDYWMHRDGRIESSRTMRSQMIGC